MTMSIRKMKLLLRWIRILTGRSYYHQPQRLGKAFKPGSLAGYFNDLTAKTQWTGETDNEGIPLCILADKRKVYFATTIVQKALGHWDLWLLGQGDFHREEFLKLCYWLLDRQDDQGGWPLWTTMNLPFASPYSAMTQGECISAFARAWKLTGKADFKTGALRALELMQKPIEEGGTAVFEETELFLEEMPSVPRSSILNGWVFALFGLYDFWLAFDNTNALDLFRQSVSTLKRHLQEYDTGYWSRYDVQGRLASSFYHDLHIHQLDALAMVDNDHILVEVRNRWVQYYQRRSNRMRAFLVKAKQKLREPGEAVIVR